MPRQPGRDSVRQNRLAGLLQQGRGATASNQMEDVVGLAAAQPEPPPQMVRVQQVPLDMIEDMANVRHGYDKEKFAGLVDSIRRDGVIVPVLLVRTDDNRFMVIDGHLRLAASRELGLDRIKAEVRDDVSLAEAWRMKLLLNLQRLDLSPWERAQAILGTKLLAEVESTRQALLDDGLSEEDLPPLDRFNLNKNTYLLELQRQQEELCKTHGVPPRRIPWAGIEADLGLTERRRQQLMQVLDIHESVARDFPTLSEAHLRRIVKARSSEDQRRLAQLAQEHDLTDVETGAVAAILIERGWDAARAHVAELKDMRQQRSVVRKVEARQRAASRSSAGAGRSTGRADERTRVIERFVETATTFLTQLKKVRSQGLMEESEVVEALHEIRRELAELRITASRRN